MRSRVAVRVTAVTLGALLALPGAPNLARSPSVGIMGSPRPTTAPAPRGETPQAPASSPSASPEAGSDGSRTLTWTPTIAALGPRGRMSQVITWRGGFAAIGKNAGGRPTVWISADGSAWTSFRSPASRDVDAVLGAVGGRLILVAGVSTDDGPHLASWSSTDGAGWRRAPDDPSMALPGHPTWGYFKLLGPATMGSRSVVVGSWSGCCGSVWWPIARSDSSSLAMAPRGRLEGTYAWTTTDGLRWTRDPVTGPRRSLECLATDGDRFLGIDYDSPLMASPDGVRWEPIGEVPFVQAADMTACVRRTSGGYLQVGNVDAPPGYGISTGTTVSVDALTWTPPSIVPGFETETSFIAVLGDLVMLPGYEHAPDVDEPAPAQLLSVDGGLTWSHTFGWPDSTMAATDGEVIVAVGDGAWVAPMPDAVPPAAGASPQPQVETAVSPP